MEPIIVGVAVMDTGRRAALVDGCEAVAAVVAELCWSGSIDPNGAVFDVRCCDRSHVERCAAVAHCTGIVAGGPLDSDVAVLDAAWSRGRAPVSSTATVGIGLRGDVGASSRALTATAFAVTTAWRSMSSVERERWRNAGFDVKIADDLSDAAFEVAWRTSPGVVLGDGVRTGTLGEPVAAVIW